MNEGRLYYILYLKREHDTAGERMLIDEVLEHYNPTEFRDTSGQALAYSIEVRMPDGSESRTLFSAHIDTVHHTKKITAIESVASNDPYLNNFRLDAINQIIYADGDVLGADDGAGVWLLLEMIDAGVPGTYLFHRGEECGGIGSSGMATYHQDFLAQFDRAIAFDRKATHSIITHQRGGRCCSDTFADELAKHLSCDDYFMGPDDGGVFTDTANYIDDIGECTNVSVGYYNEHTVDEKLDLSYLFALREKCLSLDWEALPTVRKPGEPDPDYQPYSFRGFGAYNSANYRDNDYSEVTVDELCEMEYEQILALCEDDPMSAATLIFKLLWGEAAAAEQHDDTIVEQGDYYDGDTGAPVCAGYFDDDDDYVDNYDHDVYPRLKAGLQ